MARSISYFSPLDSGVHSAPPHHKLPQDGTHGSASGDRAGQPQRGRAASSPLDAEWISAAEAFAWRAFNGSLTDAEISTNEKCFYRDYAGHPQDALRWLDDVENLRVVDARLRANRERAHPDESRDERDHAVAALLAEMPDRAQQLCSITTMLEAARDEVVAKWGAGRIAAMRFSIGAAIEQPDAPSYWLNQGMSIDLAGRLVPPIAHFARGMNGIERGSILFKTADLLAAFANECCASGAPEGLQNGAGGQDTAKPEGAQGKPRPGRPRKYDWTEAHQRIAEYLEENGSPPQHGDGGQAVIERLVTGSFSVDACPSESLIREHVTAAIQQYRQTLAQGQ